MTSTTLVIITKYQRCQNKSKPVGVWNKRKSAFVLLAWQWITEITYTDIVRHRTHLLDAAVQQRKQEYGRAFHILVERSILVLLQGRPQKKGDHLQFLRAHWGRTKKIDRTYPLSPINVINLPWILFNSKSRGVLFSLINLSFKPLEGVCVFLSPQIEILHKCGPSAGNYAA